MAYKNLDQLKKQVEALRSAPYSGSWGSPIGNAILSIKADRMDKRVAETEKQNQKVFESELARYLREKDTGQTQVPYVQGGGYTHPDLQKALLDMEKSRAGLSPERFGSPVYFENADGGFDMGQFSDRGQFKPFEGVPGMSPLPPGSVQGYNPGAITRKAETETDAQVSAIPRLARAEYQANLDTTINQRSQQITESQDKQATMEKWIDDAIDNAGFWTTGLAGTALEVIPGTPAYDLVAAIDTIKANVGLDKLQDMRNNSPTGGALGQVSEFENKLLQAVLGNLENSQSTEQLKGNLQELKVLIDQIVNRGIGRYEADYGSAGGGEDVVSEALKIISDE